MRSRKNERRVTVSLEGFDSAEVRNIRNKLSKVFGRDCNVDIRSLWEEPASQESWFERELVQENETDDEIFEDAILCVDPYNKR